MMTLPFREQYLSCYISEHMGAFVLEIFRVFDKFEYLTLYIAYVWHKI